MPSSARSSRQVTGGLSIQTSFGNGNGSGNGNGNGWRMVGLGLGLGHRLANHTRLDLRGRQLPPHRESHRVAAGVIEAEGAGVTWRAKAVSEHLLCLHAAAVSQG